MRRRSAVDQHSNVEDIISYLHRTMTGHELVLRSIHADRADQPTLVQIMRCSVDDVRFHVGQEWLSLWEVGITETPNL